ncbi:MAG: S8 family serine peptidase [Candidatus Thermoplasmatota archaeon]|nr:S8 family serine peptidase [Candidatus Thermoplasmatota archaeon]
MRRAFLLLVIFLLSGIPVVNQSEQIPEEAGIEWVKFDLPEDSIRNFVGQLDSSQSLEDRPLIAHSRLGIHDSSGILFEQEIPEELLTPRPDLRLVLVSTEFRFAEVRADISEQNGVEVREYIAPSGLLVQGTQAGLLRLAQVTGVASVQQVPLAMVVDYSMMNAEQFTPVRIESWRADSLLPGVDISDNWGMRLHQELDSVANGFLSDSNFAETGRYDGSTSASIATIAAEPSIAWIGSQPSLTIWNDQARNHMNINAMKQYYTTDLDGSGQIVGVADSGIDEDHGDFGTRIIGNVDVIGDGSTADAHSGHGTHVACTVLGDGSRGGYAGVAPEAELYFQAMENDNNGNFQWSSINNMLNTAYNNGARTHTNSWGSESSSEWGVYTSSSEDVDDRARYYDQFYSGREGLTILFAAGNDGPGSDTIGSPATAKNLLAVGNSQNRYTGAPNNIMDGSSRGPVDDGRIKPDVIAPGGYVRSCKAQEATDTGSSTWTSTWYMEYTGTSMATPNAAGTAALIREYITEVAQRPEPQGALVKALMILGARDVGVRDIPNNDEGWGRIDLKGTLAPNNGRGIWVDDRSILSSTGNSKSYSFNVTTPGQPFKAVIAWSDERGSRFSNTQLVNNLNLLVTTPSGVEYKGNEFSQGRSIQGGTHDSLNNVEVVLVDSAEAGLWTVKITDASHNGGRAQPYAVAVSGVGVNDLRPDPSPIVTSFSTDIAIPQVGDEVLVEMEVSNLGNVEAENVEVIFQEEGIFVDSQTFNLGPGGSKILFWDWEPQNAGARTLSFLVDASDTIDEINEANNRMDVIVNVTTPGVRIESETATSTLSDINVTTSSWQVTLINTALLSTNASISATGVSSPSNSPLSWYVGLDQSNFMLEGQEGAQINVTLVHPSGPDPGIYKIELLGYDEDNDVSSPFTLLLDVPVLSQTRLEFDYTTIPVHPTEVTSVDFRLFNLGNGDIGYDLFLESPPGWYAGFDDLSAQGGANSGSTGLMLEDGQMNIGISFTPPQVMTLAGAEMTVILRVVSQSEEARMMQYEIPLVVEDVLELTVDLESSFSTVIPGNSLSLQYTIENMGNADLDLSPRMQLPQGWSQNSVLEDLTLGWTQSQNFIISVTADVDARSGEISFILESNEESWSHSESVEVVVLPDPVLTFTSVEIAGETWTNIFGPGQHPVGVPINYTWIVENRENSPWNPSIVLQKDSVLLGDCTSIDVVNKGDLKALTCTIIITGNADPSSEPQFNVVLSGNSVTVNKSVTMLVASTKEVTWEIEGTNTLQTGESSLIEVTITNTGNSLVSGALKVTPPSGWSVSIDGSESLNLQAGQSQLIRLEVTPNEPGKGTILVSISGASDVTNSNAAIDLNSEGEITSESNSVVETLFWAVWIS